MRLRRWVRLAAPLGLLGLDPTWRARLAGADAIWEF
jgi:hypothetical protein